MYVLSITLSATTSRLSPLLELMPADMRTYIVVNNFDSKCTVLILTYINIIYDGFAIFIIQSMLGNLCNLEKKSKLQTFLTQLSKAYIIH